MPITTAWPAQRRVHPIVVRDRRGSEMRRMRNAVSADELVTGRMQDALRELAEARALPLIG